MKNETKIIFDNDGFIFSNNNIERHIAWNEILKIIAYKIDLIAYDDVIIEIWDDEVKVILNEENPFFEDFMKQMSIQFPNIDQDWYRKIILPPFAQNYTVLYIK